MKQLMNNEIEGVFGGDCMCYCIVYAPFSVSEPVLFPDELACETTCVEIKNVSFLYCLND